MLLLAGCALKPDCSQAKVSQLIALVNEQGWEGKLRAEGNVCALRLAVEQVALSIPREFEGAAADNERLRRLQVAIKNLNGGEL